jgi:serine/threonine protein kinase
MEKFDEYTLLKKIGAGGMAEVFKAKRIGHEGFEQVVAIKRILPALLAEEDEEEVAEFRKRFIDEAKLSALLSHKNIAKISDFGPIGDNYFIAMEYVWGKDLRTILRRCRAQSMVFPLSLALHIAKEVASALNCAHNQKDSSGRNLNIIHRDISPQNILISYEGEIKVVDFGIAKAEMQHTKTLTGGFKGKFAYASPEQAAGKRTIDRRSDIFSLGICLYEMITGEKLFKGGDISTLEKVREARVEPLPSALNPEVSPVIEAKVLKALEREPDKRYQNASDMERDLGSALFKIAESDPALQLREFMQTLFQTEIQEEKLDDVDETVYVEDGQECAPKSTSGKSKSASKTSGSKRAGVSAFVDSASKKRPAAMYGYAIAAIVLVVIGAVIAFGTVYFWPRSSKPIQASSSPVQPASPQESIPPKSSAAPAVSEGKPSIETSPTPSKTETPPPPPAPAVAASKGSLSINARPWANVYVEGKSYGRTPQTLNDLDIGTYTVRLENPDFQSFATKVKVSKKAVTKVFHEFASFGKLMINAKPWANVYVDGSLKGQTPITIEKVSSGEHVVKFIREGYAETTRTISVQPSEEKSLSVTLQKNEN